MHLALQQQEELPVDTNIPARESRGDVGEIIMGGGAIDGLLNGLPCVASAGQQWEFPRQLPDLDPSRPQNVL